MTALPLRRLGERAAALFNDLVPSEVAKGLGWCDPPWEADALDDYCPRCGASVGAYAVQRGMDNDAVGMGCSFCRGRRMPWDRVVRLAPYSEPTSNWIKFAKHTAGWTWAQWFGHQLARVIPEPARSGGALIEGPGAGPLVSQGVVVCPVPLHWTRHLRRGYNQSAEMALALAKARGWQYAPLLRRRRRTRMQTSVAAARRSPNVSGAFAIHRVDLAGYHAVVVDDVKTSGSTLGACARLMRQARAEGVYVAVAAVADPKNHDFKALSAKDVKATQ